MPKDLSRVQTIVIAMMENRSFDHLLGYLGLPGSGHPQQARIEGLQHALTYYAHDAYPPVPLQGLTLDPDPPHEREQIDTQINAPSGRMKGFVESYRPTYEKYSGAPNARLTGVMEYCMARDIPVTDFLARKFAICDDWFSCIPASTLPNRMMAMSGYTLVDHTPDGYLQEIGNIFRNNPPDMVYDWLDRKNVSWRIYYSGTFFFMQMPRLLAMYERSIQNPGQFRPIISLLDDFQRGDVTQVVFVEPLYQDDPRRGTVQATDDHAPASLVGGQRFLKILYEALKSAWEGLVAIITYDEHGSFFDHVPPRPITTDPPPNASYANGFKTSGVRVPAIVVSPFVATGSLYEGVMDNTSILKFLADKFSQGSYNQYVDPRPVGSVADVLNDDLLDPGAAISPAPDVD
jgi:phospholipase C